MVVLEKMTSKARMVLVETILLSVSFYIISV